MTFDSNETPLHASWLNIEANKMELLLQPN